MQNRLWNMRLRLCVCMAPGILPVEVRLQVSGSFMTQPQPGFLPARPRYACWTSNLDAAFDLFRCCLHVTASGSRVHAQQRVGNSEDADSAAGKGLAAGEGIRPINIFVTAHLSTRPCSS